VTTSSFSPIRSSGLPAITELLAQHHSIYGPRRDPGTLPSGQVVIQQSHTDRQSTFLVRTSVPILDPAWTVKPVSLEDLVLAYLSQSRERRMARPSRLEVVR
jgi:ABC-2 type transport system ATP-binding protein